MSVSSSDGWYSISGLNEGQLQLTSFSGEWQVRKINRGVNLEKLRESVCVWKILIRPMK